MMLVMGSEEIVSVYQAYLWCKKIQHCPNTRRTTMGQRQRDREHESKCGLLMDAGMSMTAVTHLICII